MNTLEKISLALAISLCGLSVQAEELKVDAKNNVASHVTIKDKASVLNAKTEVDFVSDRELNTIRGKYLSGLTIVGLQLELLSQWQANGNQLMAGGALQVVRVGDGYEIQMGSHAASAAGDTWSSSAGAQASGAGSLQISGIGQVSQLAGDNNQHSNMTVIDFAPQDMSAQLNGQSTSQASNGDAQVNVSFSASGASLEIQSSRSSLMQQVAVGNGVDAAGIMQVGSLVGNDQNSSNLLRLHIMTAPTDLQVATQTNVLQALQLMQPTKP